MLRAFSLLVLYLFLTPVKLQNDILDTVNGSSACSSGPPTGLTITEVQKTQARVTWSPLSSPDIVSYQILYHHESSTNFSQVVIPVSNGITTVLLENLHSFATYYVYIRAGCTVHEYGVRSNPQSLTTMPDMPSAPVSNLNVTTSVNGNPNLVYISWDHIPDSAWNGDPGDYIVIHYRLPNRVNGSYMSVKYPGNSHLMLLPSGLYGFQVSARNAQNLQATTNSIVNDILVVSPGLTGELEYPLVYIIIPGILFLAIIIAITVVIFKKVHESRKQSVTYCKDIDPGYSNALPLQERRSPSSSMSPGIQSPGANNIVHRPLPLSPTNGPSPTRLAHRHPEQEVRQNRQRFNEEPSTMWVGRLEQEPPRQQMRQQHFEHELPPNGHQPRQHFEQEPPSNRQQPRMQHFELEPPSNRQQPRMQHFEQEPPLNRHQPRQQFMVQEPPLFGGAAVTPAPKLSHPGPLPLVAEDADLIHMHRSMTNNSSGSVFSPTGPVAPTTGQPRPRAQTVGVGEASPYEVPENGSTLSRGDSTVLRPASAGVVHHHVVNKGGNFPRPPAHSPPPLTHSSMELRARMDSGEVITSPPGQNTLPRCGHQTAGSKISPGGLKHIRSEGHFPIFEADENADDAKAFLRALDNSQDTSQSSYGQNGVARRPSLETGQYPYRGGLATNGSIVESELSSFSERSDIIPRAPHHNPSHHVSPGHRGERSIKSAGRESLFSETSIELSISSTSDREVSPEWDHRGVTSDVGIGTLRESPEARETASEVGTGFSQRTHLVYKQV